MKKAGAKHICFYPKKTIKLRYNKNFMSTLYYESLLLIHRTLLLYQYEHWLQECPKWIQQVNQYLEISDIPKAVKDTLEKCKKMMKVVETTAKKQIPKLQDANQRNTKTNIECKNFGYTRESLSYLLTTLSFLKDTPRQEEREVIFSIANQAALEIGETFLFIEKYKTESIEELAKRLQPKKKKGKEYHTSKSPDDPIKRKFLGYIAGNYPFIHQSIYDEMYDLFEISRDNFKRYKAEGRPLTQRVLETGFIKYPQFSFFYDKKEIVRRLVNMEIEPFLDRELYEMFFAKEANPILIQQDIQREIDRRKHT